MKIQNKIEKVIKGLIYYLKRIRKNKSYSDVHKVIDQINVININECEKYKTALIFQMHTGKKLF